MKETKLKSENKREQAQINRSLSVERQPSKNVSQKQFSHGLFWYPDEESLTKDLTIDWRVLACILVCWLAIGLRVAHFACSFRRSQGLHYALLSSCVMCRLLSPWSLISIVSGFRVSLPFSSFSGNFLWEGKKWQVHGGQYDRVLTNTFSINSWTLWFHRGWNWH